MLYVSFLFADITIKEVFLIGSMEGAWCTNLGSTLTAGNKQTVVCNSVVCNTSVFISYRLKIHFLTRSWSSNPTKTMKTWQSNFITSRDEKQVQGQWFPAEISRNLCLLSEVQATSVKSIQNDINWCYGNLSQLHDFQY